MKRFNRILAALLAALMLCGACTTVAEMDVELEINAPVNPGSIELEIDPESGANGPDGGLQLDDGLHLDDVDLPNPELEIGIEDNLLIDGAEAQGDGPVQSNDSDSDFVIKNGVLVEYTGDGGDVVIPNSVKKIGNNAFYKNESLTSVTIPGSVTEICDGYDDYDFDEYVGAFYSCSNLKQVTFSNGLTHIGYKAFYGCDSLTSVTIPNSVTSIGKGAFGDCDSLTSVTIPDSVISIGDDAFYGCTSLTSVTIPNSVTSIGEYAFGACAHLETINVSGENRNYTSKDGILYTHDMKTLLQCPGAKTSVTIPNSVTSIGMGAFADCESLSSVAIPDSVTSIGAWAFWICESLTSVTIPDSVTSIGEYAFCDCDRLTSVTIPNRVTSIGEGAFWDCDSLTSVTILAKSIDIDDDAFYDSHPTFHIISGSDAIDWAEENGYNYDIIKDGLSEKTIRLKSGYSHQLAVLGDVDGKIIWSSSDKSVAAVNNGKVTAKKVGKCVISATLESGKTLNCDVTVYDPVEISDTTLTLNLGETYSLEITGLLKRTVSWTSSDTAVATVKNGYITPKKAGKCTITAKLSKSQYLEARTLTCKVTVKDNAELSQTSLALNAGKTTKLTVSNLAGRTVTWSSSNKNVATVKDGTVTATGGGKCTITAKVENGKTLKCAVSVTDRAKLYKYDSESENYDWDYDYSSKSEYYEKECNPIKSASLDIGETLRLVVTYTAGRKVVWSSSNTKVATVNNGKVTPTGGGKCTITAKVGGKSLSCKLTVTDPAKLSERSLSLEAGETHKLTVSNLAGRSVTWASSNKNVATVKNGTVTATGGGKCTITAKVKNGKTLKCAVSVTDRAELYEYDSESEDYDWYYDYSSKSEYYEKKCKPIKSASLDIGETLRLVVTYTAGRKVVWSSSNTKVAAVNNGKVTPTGGGKCTITAKVGGKSLSCKLTVTDTAKLSETSLSLEVGETHKLTIDNLAGRSVTWVSSNKNVATVKNGTVTAIGGGKCTITAKVGSKSLSCKLTVTDPAKLSERSLSLKAGETHKLTIDKLAGRKVTWTSSDRKVATVKDGVVTAVYMGKCTITAQIKNGKKLTCKLTVTDPAVLSETTLSLQIGSTHTLTIDGLLKRKVTWTSSNTAIATVNNGKITPKKAGKCTITAKVKNGKTYTCKLTVTDPAALSETTLSLQMGSTYTLTITGLAGRKVTWTSSNSSVATVKDGKVTAIKAGKCIITAKVKNGKTYTCKLTVTDPAALSAESLTISTIDSDKIKLTGALKRKVTWSTSNDGVVKITKSDTSAASIKAVKTGTATITAKIEGGKTLKCAVTVVNPLTIKEDWDDDFDDLAPWEVGVKFTNHSNKKIIYVTFDILQYNNRGDKLTSPYDYYYFNNDINPHSSYWDNYQVNDDTRSVKFRITEVTFADKTTWKP